jgi:hypothetical protein
MMRRPALLEAKEATGLIDVNHVKVVCFCCIGDLCQEGGGTGISVVRSMKWSRRRYVCGTWEEGKEATQEISTRDFYLLPFGMMIRKQEGSWHGNDPSGANH